MAWMLCGDPQDATPADGQRLAIGHKYLDNGTLYVARFEADGSGQWLTLIPWTGARWARYSTVWMRF